jgi:hypothetical protein
MVMPWELLLLLLLLCLLGLLCPCWQSAFAALR